MKENSLFPDTLNIFIDKTLQGQDSLLSLLKNIKEESSEKINIAFFKDQSIDNNLNKSFILFSNNDTTLVLWEQNGGKSIKYISLLFSEHNKYRGINFFQSDSDENNIKYLKRYLNLL